MNLHLSEEQAKLHQAKSAKSQKCFCFPKTFNLACNISGIPLSLTLCVKSEITLPVKTSVDS